jgi:hypothetical protein
LHFSTHEELFPNCLHFFHLIKNGIQMDHQPNNLKYLNKRQETEFVMAKGSLYGLPLVRYKVIGLPYRLPPKMAIHTEP